LDGVMLGFVVIVAVALCARSVLAETKQSS
jgi:hypothetical protein